MFRIDGEDVRRAAAEFSGNPDVRFEYTVISNIYAGGLPPAEAGERHRGTGAAILEHRAAGNRLAHLLRTAEPAPRA